MRFSVFGADAGTMSRCEEPWVSSRNPARIDPGVTPPRCAAGVTKALPVGLGADGVRVGTVPGSPSESEESEEELEEWSRAPGVDSGLPMGVLSTLVSKHMVRT